MSGPAHRCQGLVVNGMLQPPFGVQPVTAFVMITTTVAALEFTTWQALFWTHIYLLI